MIRNAIAHLLVGTLFVLGVLGCSNTTDTTHPDRTAVVPEMDSPVVPLAQGGGEDEVPAGAGANPGVQKKLDDLARRDRIAQQQKGVVAEYYYKSARTLFQQARYRESRESLLEVLKLDNNHVAARELLTEVNNFVVIKYDEQRKRLDAEVEKIKVRISQALMEVKIRYQDGTDLMAKNQFEGAIEKFESAQEILRWLPYEVHKREWQERLDSQVEAAKKKKSAWERDVSRRQREEARFREIVEEKGRQEALKKKVSLLFRNANIQFQKERYIQAEKFAGQILHLDPFNKDAKRLKEIALRARHMQANDQNRTTYIEEWRRTFEQMDESVKPQVAVVRYPNIEEWKRIANRKVEQAGGDDSGKDREEREIISKLEGLRVTLDFEDNTLQEVVDFISTNYNLNVVIDPQVLSERAEDELQVALKVKNINLKEALELILDLLDLDYVIQNQVIKITDKSNASGKSVTKVYNVQDLVIKIQDFPGPKIDIAAGSDDGDVGGIGLDDGDDGEGAVNFDALRTLIEENIGTGTWDEPNSILVRQGSLIVKNTPAVHDDIVSLLGQLRQSTGLLVAIETRFLLVRDDFLQDIGVDFRGLGTQQTPTTANPNLVRNPLPPIQAARALDDTLFGAVGAPAGAGSDDTGGIFFDNNSESNSGSTSDLRSRIEHVFASALGSTSILTNSGGLALSYGLTDEVSFNAILRAVEKSDRMNQLTAPRLTAFNTQRANISVLRQFGYIRDFDVQVAQSASVADPIIGQVQDGIVLDVRPTISSNRKFITLELHPAVAELERPIRVFNTNLGQAGQSVNIELPRVTFRRLDTTVTIPDKGTLVLGGLTVYSELDRKSEVPFFARVPLLNLLFSRKQKSSFRENLIILLRAEIVKWDELEPTLPGTEQK